jgi:hypothetical protein
MFYIQKITLAIVAITLYIASREAEAFVPSAELPRSTLIFFSDDLMVEDEAPDSLPYYVKRLPLPPKIDPPMEFLIEAITSSSSSYKEYDLNYLHQERRGEWEEIEGGFVYHDTFPTKSEIQVKAYLNSSQ